MVTDNYKTNFSATVYQNPDLTTNLPGKPANFAGQFEGNQKFRRDAPAVKLFYPFELIRLQTGDISVNFFQERDFGVIALIAFSQAAGLNKTVSLIEQETL